MRICYYILILISSITIGCRVCVLHSSRSENTQFIVERDFYDSTGHYDRYFKNLIAKGKIGSYTERRYDSGHVEYAFSMKPSSSIMVTSLMSYQSMANWDNKSDVPDILLIRRINANSKEDTVLKVIDSTIIAPNSRTFYFITGKTLHLWRK